MNRPQSTSSSLATTFILLLGISTAALMTGCATSQTVINKTGTSRTFTAPFNDVKAATRYSIETLNVNISKIEESESSYAIWFTKPVSAWSWGEQGLVSLQPLLNGQSTQVEVKSDKNSKLQITGTDQEEFAAAIFKGIERGLKDLQQ